MNDCPRSYVVTEYISIFLLIICSKSTIYLMYPKMMMIIYALFGLILFFKFPSTYRIQNSKALVLLLVIMLTNSLWHNYFNICDYVFIWGTYAIINCIDFLRFKKIYLDIVSVIAFFGAVVYFGVLFNIISPYYQELSDRQLWMYSWYNFQTELTWFREYRSSGIFHEPGFYQIILNVALLFYISEISEKKLNKKQIIQVVVIVLAVFLTRSTNAYISIVVIFGSVIYRFGQSHKIYIIPLFILFCYILVKVLNSDVIVDKFAKADVDGSSYSVRAADARSCIEIIIDKPLLGLGSGALFVIRSAKYGNISSSNGILAMTAKYGIFWILTYIFFFIKNIIVYTNGDMKFFISFTLIVIILFSNQDAMWLPISYLFYFRMSTYNVNYKRQNIL